MRELLVLGHGYSAARFVARHAGLFDRVTVTARSPEKLDVLRAAGLHAERFDGEGPDDLGPALASATHVLCSVPPGPSGDPALARVRAAETPRLAWIGYLSTLGVYGDAAGGWVDETTPPAPQEPRGVRRVAAEQGWAALGAARGASVQLFRLAGIYGPGRNALVQLREGTARRIVKPGQVFNRIHVDDIAGAVAAGIGRPEVTGAVNVCDDEPAPPQDVIAFAAGLLGVPPPPEVPFEAAGLSEMARSFYGSNKRVANARLRQELGVDLAYPTYREGLAALLAAGE